MKSLLIIFNKYKTWISLFLLLIVIVYAANLRFQYFVIAKEMPLGPDSETFYQLAHTTPHFYSASFREPVFVFLIKLFLWIFGDKPWVVVLISCVFSILVIPLVYYIGLRAYNSFVGLGSAFIVAITPHVVYGSFRGLRIEVYSFFMLLYMYFLFVNKRFSSATRLIISGILGGFICLLRLEFLSVVFILSGYSLIAEILSRKQDKVAVMKETFLSLSITVLLIIPFLISNQLVYNEPFYGQNSHATFWRNQEFAGQEGYPTIEAVVKKGYTGKRVTVSHYIFGMHTIGEVITRYFKGYFLVFKRYLKFILLDDNVFVLLGIAGFIGMLFSYKRYIVVTFLSAIFPVAFILSVDSPLTRSADIRFILHAYPLFAIANAYCMYMIIYMGIKLAKKFSESKQLPIKQ